MGRNNTAFIVLGIVALALGISIKLFIGRRRFSRRNPAGLEGFKNYRNALITPFFETVVTLIGSSLIVVGVLCLGMAMFVGK
jgi:hypothetical protein